MRKQYFRQGESINLEDDFPQIEDINGIVKVKPSFGGPREEVKPFTKSNLPVGYIYCESEVCNKGGVPLGELLWNLLSRMVKNKQVEGHDSEICKGYENMGRYQTRRCMTTFVTVEVQIKYRELEAEKRE